jgi:hypothetical protein
MNARLARSMTSAVPPTSSTDTQVKRRVIAGC